MSQYDFKTLSDKEFEVLCADLLSEALSTKFERFKPGRDGGVDARYFSPDGEVVLQCKHWINTPLNQLIYDLQKTEAPKVKRLRPSRYFIAVSHPLSRADKDKIFKIFSPYLRSPADVYGAEDLNDLLGKHPGVERVHYKLWIASTQVLGALLNAPIYGRSDFLISDISAQSHRYVITGNHTKALSRLNEKHIVIITGDAGVGKTTLARNLLIPYLAEGYELFCISDSIDEVEGVFAKDKKQIFYFDDFLGSNYLDAIQGNSGTSVVQFMKRVKSDASKRFILTSRTTILSQGKVLINALTESNTSKDEFEISMQSISELEKAKILYNHIWHSDLSPEHKGEIFRQKRYRKIIAHKNYNPRLVSYFTDDQRLDEVPSKDYWKHVIGMLNNPADVWAHPFDAQQDDFGRAIILLASLNGRALSQHELSDAYSRLISRPEFSSAKGHRDFLRNLRHLCGSMLNRTVLGSRDSISLFNPSVRDFIIARYRSDLSTVGEVLRALRTVESLRVAKSLFLSTATEVASTIALFKSIALDADASEYVGYSPEYIAQLYIFLHERTEFDIGKFKDWIESAARFIELEKLPSQFDSIIRFYILARHAGVDAPLSIHRLVENATDRNPSIGELEDLARLSAMMEVSKETLALFKSTVGECFVDQIYDEFPAEDVFHGLPWDNDWFEAKAQLADQVRDRLRIFGMSDDLELIREITGSYNFNDQAEGYYMGDDNGERESDSRSFLQIGSDIDDLFDQS